jgi:3-oxoacyl-[acyl-carrier-protein] synthase-3
MAETVANVSAISPRSMTGVRVLGVGSYTPENVVTNADLAERGFDADWIAQRTGIRERRIAPPEMATSDMAVMAGQNCLAAAGVSPQQVDLIILATFTPDVPVPSTACLVQHRMGVSAPAFDLQNGCAGFMFALVTAMQFIHSGTNRCVLVIGADTNSRISNPQDIKTYPLFGDGAGAVLLAPGESDQGLTSYVLGTDGSGFDLLIRTMGGSRMVVSSAGFDRCDQFLRMDGKAVFKWAVRILHDSTQDVLRHAQLTMADIDLVVYHQANTRILDAAAQMLGIDREKMFVNLDRYGNTSAASIPLALDEAAKAGLIHRGSRILLSGYGAGLAWGTGILRW